MLYAGMVVIVIIFLYSQKYLRCAIAQWINKRNKLKYCVLWSFEWGDQTFCPQIGHTKNISPPNIHDKHDAKVNYPKVPAFNSCRIVRAHLRGAFKKFIQEAFRHPIIIILSAGNVFVSTSKYCIYNNYKQIKIIVTFFPHKLTPSAAFCT